jgi:hypothetical protein
LFSRRERRVRRGKNRKIENDGFSNLYVEKYLDFLCTPCVLSGAVQRKRPLSLAEAAEHAESKNPR